MTTPLPKVCKHHQACMLSFTSMTGAEWASVCAGERMGKSKTLQCAACFFERDTRHITKLFPISRKGAVQDTWVKSTLGAHRASCLILWILAPYLKYILDRIGVKEQHYPMVVSTEVIWDMNTLPSLERRFLLYCASVALFQCLDAYSSFFPANPL